MAFIGTGAGPGVSSRLDRLEGNLFGVLDARTDGWVSVTEKRFAGGADPTGVADSTVAIQAAINSGRSILFPFGNYRVASSLTIPPEPAAIRMYAHNGFRWVSGATAQVQIFSQASALFVPLNASSYSSLSRVSVDIEGISFKSSADTNSVFGRAGAAISLYASRLENCNFWNFKHIVYGAISGVTRVRRNTFGNLNGPAVARPTDYDPAIVTIVDSEISSNYFNGNPAKADVTLLEAQAAQSSSIAGNYFDFAFRGIALGGGNGLVTVADNTFDILYIGAEILYGGKELTLHGNRFFRIRKESASYFSNPTTQMTTTDWTSVLIGATVVDISISGSVIRDTERFVDVVGNQHKNIKEWGTVGTLESGQPLVRLGSMTIDGGYTGDGTGFDIASRRKSGALAYSANVDVDLTKGDELTVTVTNGTAFTIGNPYTPIIGQIFRLTIRNTSGGALGAITWGTAYKLSTWASPATGYSRSIAFRWDGTNAIEVSRTPADVPN